jgi:hypothetical protein
MTNFPEGSWNGDKCEYGRLHDVIVTVRHPNGTARLSIVEREIEGSKCQPDSSFVSTCNRLGAAGWIVSPMSAGAMVESEVPAFMITAVRDEHPDWVVTGTGTWATYWLSRRLP